MYSVRDKDGILKAYLTDDLAKNAIASSEGHTKMKKYKTSTPGVYEHKLAFTFSTDQTLSFGRGASGLKLFFWSGDQIIKEND